MNALWYYAIFFIIIWILALIFRNKLKIEIQGPLLMRRTKRMIVFIDSVANRHLRFWKYSMNVGIPVAVFFMAVIFYLLIISLKTVFTAPQIGIVIPGVDIPGSPIFVPLGYGLIGLMTVIVVHEFGHGILARVEGVKIKSIGLLLLAILPGAFVEPDEEEIKKSNRLSKLRIFSAGSVFNLGLAGVAFVIYYLLSTFFIAPVFHAEGLEIANVVSNGPASGIVTEGMIIQSLNGYNIQNRQDFAKILNKTKPGDQVIVKTDQGSFKIKTGKNPNDPSIAYIGIRSQEHLAVKKSIANIYGILIPWGLFYFTNLLFWIFFLNFGIGTFNLLPLKPLDGGLIFEELINYVTSEKTAHIATYIVSVVSITLVVVNIGYGLLNAIL
jgi:membrane-associated protease RseP (regulator of RpoE activity)